MKTQLPKSIWTILFFFFLFPFLSASAVLLGGDRSSVVRLAFALCGFVILYIGGTHGLFPTLRHGARWWHELSARKQFRQWLCVGMILSCTVLILTPPFLQARSMARAASLSSELKIYGLALLEFAGANHGNLPPHTGRKHIGTYLSPHYRVSSLPTTGFGKPFVWCNALSGLRLRDVKKPEEVIVAYACQPAGSFGYAALYLDGHVKYLRHQQLREQLRDREALLAPAIQAKVSRQVATSKTGVKSKQ
jgi:hypothetical protein